MKKGCFGCFGGGCLVMIAIVAILTYAGYNFVQTTGRDALAVELHALVKSLIDKGISDEKNNAEAHEIANNFVSSIKSKEIGFMNVLTQIDKVFDDEQFVKTGIISMYKQIDDEDFTATEDEKNSMKQFITALYHNKLNKSQLEGFSQILKASEWQKEKPDQLINDADNKTIFLNYDSLISKDLTKESFSKALEAITRFTKENALEEIDDNFDTDTYVSFDIKNIIFRLSNPILAEELAEEPSK
jgi:hypothetical protein